MPGGEKSLAPDAAAGHDTAVIVGDVVSLRAVTRDELRQVYEWEQDPDHMATVDSRPYVPRNFEDWLRVWDEPRSFSHALFGISEGSAVDGRLLGTCNLWQIDDYHRNAHVGIGLAEAYRGHGYGRAALELLVRFAFRNRGLHRLSLETLEHNSAMRRCAERVGFVAEGRLRQNAWSAGAYVDEVLYGLLAAEWRTRQG